MSSTNSNVSAFRRAVWAHYRAHGRHDLPWRASHDPYHVLVSEIMLQQTQVERVIPYYEQWMRAFPRVETLAHAPLSSVLRLWQGLGYNRRAKMLHEAAKALASLPEFPQSSEALEKLPGIGPYTAGAVMAFAFNKDVTLIETNIRTVVIHHFFPHKKGAPRTVADKEVLAILRKAFPRGRAREWYAALMDYGASLKRSGVRVNARVKGYTKQKAFAGSLREARGAMLKELARRTQDENTLLNLLGTKRKAQMRSALTALTREGMVKMGERGRYRLPR